MGLEHRLLNDTAEKRLMKQIYVAKTRGKQEVLKSFSKSVMIIKERQVDFTKKHFASRYVRGELIVTLLHQFPNLLSL